MTLNKTDRIVITLGTQIVGGQIRSRFAAAGRG
jgi:hypothetical protein